MGREVEHQYDYMTRPESEGGLGIHHEVTPEDPYNPKKGFRDMAHDVRVNKQIRTLATKTTGSHAYFTDEQNDKFRAVHDVFGHAATGRGFSRHGEEAAWRSHVQMFSPKAREAMTSETRGQNSVLNYSPHGGFIPQHEAMTGMSKLSQSPQASAILKRQTPARPEPGSEQLKLFP